MQLDIVIVQQAFGSNCRKPLTLHQLLLLMPDFQMLTSSLIILIKFNVITTFNKHNQVYYGLNEQAVLALIRKKKYQQIINQTQSQKQIDRLKQFYLEGHSKNQLQTYTKQNCFKRNAQQSLKQNKSKKKVKIDNTLYRLDYQKLNQQIVKNKILQYSYLNYTKGYQLIKFMLDMQQNIHSQYSSQIAIDKFTQQKNFLHQFQLIKTVQYKATTKYSLNLQYLLKATKLYYIGQVIKEKYGYDALRIISIITQSKIIQIKKVVYKSLMNQKDARRIVNNLIKDGIVDFSVKICYQEIKGSKQTVYTVECSDIKLKNFLSKLIKTIILNLKQFQLKLKEQLKKNILRIKKTQQKICQLDSLMHIIQF